MRCLSVLLWLLCFNVHGAAVAITDKATTSEGSSSYKTTVETIKGRKFWIGARVAVSPFHTSDSRQYISMMLEEGYQSKFFEHITFKELLAIVDKDEKLAESLRHAFPAEMENTKFGIYSVFTVAKNKLIGYFALHPGYQSIRRVVVGSDEFLVREEMYEYSELQLIIHPLFRGKGLGTDVRKVLYHGIVSPMLGKKTLGIDFCKLSRCKSIVEVTHTLDFPGVKSFVDISNTASLRSLLKAGATLVAIFNADNGTETAQFVYPPRPEVSALAGITSRHTELLKRGTEDALDTIRKEFGLTAK